MSSTVSSRQVRSYNHSSDLPEEVFRALSDNEAAANIILPFANKASELPRGGDDEQLWVVLYDGDNVDFVLSCTKGPLGNYPIFIVTSKSVAQIAQKEELDGSVTNSLSLLVDCLLEKVLPKRVFSVFAIAKVAQKFSEIFVARTHQEHHIQADEEFRYDATFTFCTSKTFKESLDLTFPNGELENIISLCRADMSHLAGVTVLCKAFSETSPPYILDDERAELEAKTMIDSQQVWVHLVQRNDQEPEIACLIATTRESDNVTAVTKVFTPEHWRGRRCAERLLHRICQQILAQKERVVLYVGNSEELAAARRVYHKIGFQGLDGSQGQQVEGVERWIEIGFKGTTLGYW